MVYETYSVNWSSKKSNMDVTRCFREMLLKGKPGRCLSIIKATSAAATEVRCGYSVASTTGSEKYVGNVKFLFVR